MEHQTTPIAEDQPTSTGRRPSPTRGHTWPRPWIGALVALLAIVMVVTAQIGSEDRRTSFASEIGALDTAAVPHGWAPLIEAAADESGIPAPVLAAQIEVESSWRADAVSPAGAQGPAQFMPGTWEIYGRGGDPHNPEHAIAAQGRFMGDLLDLAEDSSIEGDPLELALAGYNAGFGAVERYDGIPPYPETENYVAAIRERTPNYDRTA